MLTLRNIFRVSLLFFLLLSVNAFGNDNIKAILNIKLYFEPHEHKKKLTYSVILPKVENCSYYLGSDLPAWHFVNSSIIEGEFYPMELVNLRIHPSQGDFEINKKSLNNKVCLIIKDAESARIIWQGELNYKNNIITVVTKIDNQKYYDTKLKIDNAEKTVWLESTDLLLK